MGLLAEGPYKASSAPITLEVEGTAVPAVEAAPSDGPILGGIVLVPDISGLRPLFDDICRLLASHGFAVCAPETFARQITAAGHPLDIEERRALASELHDDVVMADLAEAADHLAARCGVERPSIMGFCLGGTYTLKGAATGRFGRAVAFYGILRTPAAFAGPGQRDALETVAAACPTLAIFGELDKLAPPPHVDELRALWIAHPEHHIVVYPDADHAFVHVPERPVHRPDDAADAWHRALRFLLD